MRLGKMKLETDAKFEARSRSNGWSLPPHPLQFISWGCVLYFAIIYYTTLVPGLPTEWQPAGYIIQGLASLCHVITHLVASTINPADPAVLRKHHKRLAMFDRQKHRHVIENQHCYLCDVNVGAKSKHCSACNKCVSDFDHHCKWLNNCVGGRNYRWFISTLVSAIVSCLLMFIISLLQFVAYYTDREDGLILQQYRDFVNSNASLPVFEVVYQSVSDEGWQSVVAITGILNFISLGLLIHLLTFHIYLLCKGISTYEFIVKQREAAMELSESDSAEDGRGKGARAKGNKIAPSNGRASIELKEKASEDSFRAGKKKFSRKTESEWPDDFRAAKGSDGETPPPAPSPPTQLNSLNTQNSSAKLHPVGVKKKRKRKKKAPRPMPVAKEEGEISTIGTPDLYKRHGFEARRIELPITPVTIRRSAEFTPPLATVEDFHSDSAESLKEIPTNSSYPTNISRPLPYAPNGKMTDSIHLSNGDARVSGVGDQLFGRIDGSQPHSPFSLTTIQNGSLSSGHSYPGADDTLTRLSADQGSFSKGRSISPLAYHTLPPLSKPGQVPPLDLSVLRTSAESSLSYQPYSGLRSATDTYRHYEPFEPSEKTLQEAVLEV